MGRILGLGIVLLVVSLGAYLAWGPVELNSERRADVANASAPVPAATPVTAPETVDPACLWPVLDAVFSPDAPAAPARISLQGCAPEAAEHESDADWTRVSLHIGDDPADAGFARRFSGVKTAQITNEGRIALEAYDNWGGSGVFSALIIGRLASQATELTDIGARAFGDRCNGGLAGTQVGSDGNLIASANMTPWDILMTPLSQLPADDQWDAGKARFGAAFSSVSSCAICCSGVTDEYAVSAEGVFTPVGLRFNPKAATSPDDPLSTCLEQAVRAAAGEDGLVSQRERAKLGGLIDGCVSDSTN